jgi:peptidoglycan/LPS O-acetylase OafA/YrhL
MLVMTPRRPVDIRTEVRIEPERDARPLDERLAEPIPVRWAFWGIVALVGANVAAWMLEPVPANPNLPEPWFVALPSVVAMVAMLGALGGLLTRRRWGMALSLLAASIAVVMVVACPLSGHHTFGLWWVGEISSLAAWAGVSLAGLRSGSARPS